MSEDCVIDVDLADVFEGPDRKGFLHTLAWGDYVDVLETTATHLCVSTAKYEQDSRGSILPVKTEAYICPTKASGIKPPRSSSRGQTARSSRSTSSTCSRGTAPSSNRPTAR